MFITSAHEDYLADSLLLGFRALFGEDAVDFPRCDILYRDCPECMLKLVRGYGFTLYTGLLEEVTVDRFFIGPKLKQGWYDLVVFSDIWRQFGLFAQWRPYLRPENTVLLDGADSAQVFPHAGYWWRRPYFWTLPRPTCGFLYFKREWTVNSQFNFWHRLVPTILREFLPRYSGLRRVSFAFPDEKIARELPSKSKEFARHLVDPEVAQRISGSVTSYAFNREEDYYHDLQISRFSVTTKKAGWDCLRHYEIAGNGCVPCFLDLHLKPANCAPHGLVAGMNCLSYRNADDLFAQIGRLSEVDYSKLQQGALAWVRSKSSTMVAGDIVREWQKSWRDMPPATLI